MVTIELVALANLATTGPGEAFAKLSFKAHNLKVGDIGLFLCVSFNVVGQPNSEIKHDVRRLNKAASRQRWNELRDKWNEYDPIGVLDNADWPIDEYEAYVGRTMRLLEQGVTAEDIVEYLEQASSNMGLNFDRSKALYHATEFIHWYHEKWNNTRA